jgi:hypothetical protein
MMMPDKELTLEIIRELLSNEKSAKSNNLPAAIEALISPFVKRRRKIEGLSEDTRIIIDAAIKKNGYCTNCRIEKIARAGDAVCAKCKKSSKEICKKTIQDKFLKL